MAARTCPTDLATMCGRHLRIGHLPLDRLPGGGRVTLSVHCSRFDADEVWISLTGTEARRLADALMREAATLQTPGPGGDAVGAPPTPARTATPSANAGWTR